MKRPLLADAFAHHVWATLRLVDACLELRPEDLAVAVPGTYGSVLNTLRHIVEGDSFYLYVASGESTAVARTAGMDLPGLKAAMRTNGAEWSRLLREDPDPDAMMGETDESDGYQREAPMGIRLAQALHHGTEHRSQVCNALAALGLQPPPVSVWDFGLEEGRITELYPQPDFRRAGDG